MAPGPVPLVDTLLFWGGATLRGMWDLSSLTRAQTHAPHTASMQS